MSAVRCRIDQYIIRLFLKSALDHRLQILIFYLKFLEREIIHINDKFIIPVFDLCDHRVQILELMLVYFDHPKSIIIIFIDDRLDTGRFSGSGISE